MVTLLVTRRPRIRLRRRGRIRLRVKPRKRVSRFRRGIRRIRKFARRGRQRRRERQASGQLQQFAVPLGFGAGAGARAVSLAGRGARAFFGTPRKAIITTLVAPPAVGILTTQVGRRLIDPRARFKTARKFGTDPSGFIKGTFTGITGIGEPQPLAADIRALERSARGMGFDIPRRKTFADIIPSVPVSAPSFVLPLGLGAGITAALLGIGSAVSQRARARDITPIGAVSPQTTAPEETQPVGAPALEAAVPNIRVNVKPTINVRSTSKPKIINILQSSTG